MNPSFVRLQTSLASAMIRLAVWIGRRELFRREGVNAGDAVTLACDSHGVWKGSALFAYQAPGWAVFEDLSGHLGSIPPPRWLDLAGSDSPIFAGYNDAIHYGELLVAEGGRVVRSFLEDADDEVLRSEGQLPEERVQPIKTWNDVASLVDNDPILAKAPAQGILWLHALA